MLGLADLTLRDIAKALRHRWPEATEIRLTIGRDRFDLVAVFQAPAPNERFAHHLHESGSL